MLVKAADEKDKILTQVTSKVKIAQVRRQSPDNWVTGKKLTNSKQLK